MAIEEVVVFEEFRDVGLAAAAVDAAILQTESIGITTIEASIPIGNSAARRIAESCGFVETGRSDSEVSVRLSVAPGPG